MTWDCNCILSFKYFLYKSNIEYYFKSPKPRYCILFNTLSLHGGIFSLFIMPNNSFMQLSLNNSILKLSLCMHFAILVSYSSFVSYNKYFIVSLILSILLFSKNFSFRISASPPKYLSLVLNAFINNNIKLLMILFQRYFYPL